MPQPPLFATERRLAGFCRASAALYFALAAGCAAAPWFGDERGLSTTWSVLAVSLLISSATACLVTAARPRERRHALLPVLMAELTACALSLAHLGSRGALTVLLASGMLFVLTAFVYRSAAPGVRSEPARESPEERAQGPVPVALGIKKAN
ncbi:MAG TPA: hypothetical protein VGH20_02695 [Myxococcales bacterium]|jgi:hypothetical protein